MGVGKSVIIDLPQDAAEIFVANPKIANAVVRSPRKLYVIGMDTGQTSVFALDRQGRQIEHLEVSIGSPPIYYSIDISGLQRMLHVVMPTAAIKPRAVKDTIILTGAVDSIEDSQRAVDIALGVTLCVTAALGLIYTVQGGVGSIGRNDADLYLLAWGVLGVVSLVVLLTGARAIYEARWGARASRTPSRSGARHTPQSIF